VGEENKTKSTFWTEKMEGGIYLEGENVRRGNTALGEDGGEA